MPSSADIDGGEFGIDYSLRNSLAFNASNDAVAIPMLQPRRRIFATAPLHEIDGPGLVLANITNHSLE